MQPRRLRRAALLGALVVGGSTAPAAAVSARPSGRRAAPKVVHHATTKAHALTKPGMKPIESIALTPGTWSIFAKATAVDPGSTDFFRCQLLSGTKPIDGATSQLSSSSLPRDTITNVAVLKTKVNVTVHHNCGHDGDPGDSGSIDAGASIVAFLSLPARVRLTRTTGQTPLPNQVTTVVANLSLPKGKWIVATKESIVNLSGPTVNTSCGIGDAVAVAHLLGPIAAGLHGVSTVLHVGAIGLASTATITLECESADNGTYMDPDALIWAWKASDLNASGDQCPHTGSVTTKNDALVLEPQDCTIGAGNFATQLAGAHLRAGTWVGIGALDNLAPFGTSVATCELLDAGHSRALDTASATLPGAAQFNPSTQITDLGVITVAKKAEVDGRCGESGSANAPGANTSSWAFIKP